MRNSTEITITGNLTDDPELRFTGTGVPVANFTVATTPRFQKNGEWQDGTPAFWNCTVWRGMAENVAETLERGSRVVVVGRVNAQQWETPEGEKRSRLVVDVDDVGASLMFASARIQRAKRTTQRRAGSAPGRERQSTTPPAEPPAGEDGPWSDDPWQTQAQGTTDADQAGNAS